MKLPGQEGAGGLPAPVANFVYAAGEVIQSYTVPAMASALAITAFTGGIPAIAVADAMPPPRPKRPPGECDGSSRMLGHSKRQIIMDYFVICQRDSVAQAAGIEGNLMQESTLQTEEIETGGFSRNPADAGGSGWGIAQWTPGSRALSESRRYGIRGPIYSLRTQLALVSAEMRGESPTGQRNMLIKLKRTRDPAHAAESFEQYFEEGPIAAIGGGQLSQRQQYARQAARACGPAAREAALNIYRNSASSP